MLVLKVNYITSALAIVFGLICLFLLNITEIIPQVLFTYGLANLANTYIYQVTKKISLTYYISSLMALVTALIVTL